MAATKRDRAEDATERVSKKSKTEAEDVSPEEKARLKKEKKEKKKAKKEKKEKKKAKKEKKEKKVESEEDVEMKEEEAEEEVKEEKKSKKEKKDKKDKKEKKAKKEETAAPAAAPVADEDASYVQTLSLSELPQSEIDAFLEKNEIAITDPLNKTSHLRPITEFQHIPTSNLLEKRPFAHFKTPSPIQAASWPHTLSGRDAVGVAETGSGKTMAFSLPLVECLSNISGKGIKAVVVSPTRELAMQSQEQISKLASLVRLKSVCIYGGASKDDQRNLLQRGADIIVATPGRLKDFMSDGTISLSGARFVVLDEADRMLDKGFEEDIKLILGDCPQKEKRQTLMFTATWPTSVQQIASTFMVDPVKITIGNQGKVDASGAVELQANARISQTVEVLEPRDKEFRLMQILKEHQQGKKKNDRILVFCLYKKEATRVEQTLARKGVRVGGIHGDLRQEQRTRSLEAFKKGETPVLVATDVAARGLDIPDVELVINCTFPLTIEDYVHRIGRTGRAGKTGKAITLFTINDKAHSGTLINILRGANQPVPEELMKFGTTVKKKTHDLYGSFAKDVDMNAKPTKVTFDD